MLKFSVSPMNILQIISIALSMVCVVITTILAWVAIAKAQKVQVTFAGTPVDKKDCGVMMADAKEKIDHLFSKLGGMERGVEGRLNARLDAMAAESKTDREKLHFRINPIEGEICALREASETNTTRLVQMDAKIDRLIERMK
jgi:hypothetical protein